MMSSQWGQIPDWAYESTHALMASLKLVDPLTYQHCLRVGEMSRKLARDAGLNEYEQKLCEFAGLFHDIGKIGIDQSILLKPGKLDDIEYAKMKNHPLLSEAIVRPLASHPFFAQMLAGIRGHHERLDGQGYPDRLNGDDIPLMARVILVVDTFDAMSQTRPYRKGLPTDVVYAEIKRCAGTQFDPQLVKIFLQAHEGWTTQDADQETLHRLIKKVA